MRPKNTILKNILIIDDDVTIGNCLLYTSRCTAGIFCTLWDYAEYGCNGNRLGHVSGLVDSGNHLYPCLLYTSRCV